jgi:hypothetical protein
MLPEDLQQEVQLHEAIYEAHDQLTPETIMRSTGHFDPFRRDVLDDEACSPSIGWQCIRPTSRIVESSAQSPSRLTAYTVRRSIAASSWYDTLVRRLLGADAYKNKDGDWKQSNFSSESKRLFSQLNEDNRCFPSLS